MSPPVWIDTHAHWHAPDFDGLAPVLRAQAAIDNVAICVVPAVSPDDFDAACAWAHAHHDAYALGLHPVLTATLGPDALDRFTQAMQRHHADPHLVAVGEIGLDGLVPALQHAPLKALQQRLFEEQLAWAKTHDWPVLMHSRHAVDAVLAALRRVGGARWRWSGVVHAFNGSLQQAQQAIDLGLCIGLGGALTYPRAQRLQRLAVSLPLHALVLETDAPDMPPSWLYRTAAERAAGAITPPNSSAELPRIAAEVARLRQMPTVDLARATTANALRALPRLAGCGLAAPATAPVGERGPGPCSGRR